ncbi:MAG TPA: methylglyoxal synthase [Thiothrix sp.]|nr:methylglyoxal synthase [Thiothrix sp.]
MAEQKTTIALVAHDNMKQNLVNWADKNKENLAQCFLFATGTTGKRIIEKTGLKVTCLRSGPYGGDQQIGSRITEGTIDMLIFFWDPMTPMPHDADIKALQRLATLMDIPTASNESTADCILHSLQAKQTKAEKHSATRLSHAFNHHWLTASAPQLNNDMIHFSPKNPQNSHLFNPQEKDTAPLTNLDTA